MQVINKQAASGLGECRLDASLSLIFKSITVLFLLCEDLHIFGVHDVSMFLHGLINVLLCFDMV